MYLNYLIEINYWKTGLFIQSYLLSAKMENTQLVKEQVRHLPLLFTVLSLYCRVQPLIEDLMIHNLFWLHNG